MPRLKWWLPWVLTATVCALLLSSALTSADVPWFVRVGLVLAWCGATARPREALLALAGIGPVIGAFAARWEVPIRWPEAAALAVLGGVMLRQAAHAPAVEANERRQRHAAILFAAVIAASCAVQLAVQQRTTAFPSEFLAEVWHFVTRDFLRHTNPFQTITDAALLLEGLALFVAVRLLAQRHATYPIQLIQMCVIGGAGLACLNVYRVLQVGLPEGLSLREIATLVSRHRFNITYGDFNAAGSYFALLVPGALGLAAAPGLRRWLWSGVTVVLAIALWLAGSRVALVAAALGVALSLVMVATGRRVRARWVIGGGLIAAAGIGWLFLVYPAARNATASDAIAARRDLARVALDMVATRPVFGVGIGSFYARSLDYMPEWLKQLHGAENAHNNFLQILAELGIVGLALFLFLLGLTAAAGYSRAPPPPVLGCLVGLGVFLLTCLGGHPLLTRDVAYAFWTLLGVVAATEPAVTPAASPDQRVSRLRSRVLPLAIVVVLATIPFRITSEWRDEPFRDASIGLSRWQGAPDGTRFRWAAGRSRFFVPGELPAARFPLRLEQGWAGPVTVDVLLDGTLANRVVVTAERWTWVTVVLQPRDASRSRMIELVVPGLDDRAEPGKHPEGGLMVGRYGGL